MKSYKLMIKSSKKTNQRYKQKILKFNLSIKKSKYSSFSTKQSLLRTQPSKPKSKISDLLNYNIKNLVGTLFQVETLL